MSRERELRFASDSVAAYAALGVIAMAGVYYANIIPALVGSLMDGAGFSEQQAGYTSAANIYGSTLGAFLAVLVVKSIGWKRVVTLALLAQAVLDLTSGWVHSFEFLTPLRFLSGTVGGLVTGVAYAVIARVRYPTRAFGFMVTVTVLLGGLGIYLLPPLVPLIGTKGLFLTLLFWEMLALVLVHLLSDYPIKAEPGPTVGPRLKMGLPAILILGSVFLYQATNMEMFAYMQRFGLHLGYTINWVSFSVAVGAWVSVVGSFLAVALSTRYGRLMPVVVSTVLSLGAFVLYGYAAERQLFLAANILQQIPWAFLMSYLFGMCAELDYSGRMAALGGVMSKLGMATGPLVAATLLTGEGYDVLIHLAIAGTVLTFSCALYPAIVIDRHGSLKTYESPVAGGVGAGVGR